MKVAISTDGNVVSAHFGRCPSFTVLDINKGKVVKRETVDNPGHAPGSIPQFLHKKGVETVIAGGMGMRATGFFNELGIDTIVGISGTVDDVINQFLKGTLRGGNSLCRPGSGKGYGIEKNICDHPDEDHKKC
jgi:predicted Fe-Mo cluster-binding NifX family protein